MGTLWSGPGGLTPFCAVEEGASLLLSSALIPIGTAGVFPDWRGYAERAQVRETGRDDSARLACHLLTVRLWGGHMSFERGFVYVEWR